MASTRATTTAITEDRLLILGPDEGTAYPGDVLQKVEASQTGGHWGVAVVWGVPGEGGQTHIHDGEAEAFFILEGTVDFLGATSRTPLGPGSFVLVPPDTEHGVRITGSGPARWLAIWPAALDGMFSEIGSIEDVNQEAYDQVRLRHGVRAGRDRRDEFAGQG
ncbi:MAG TPA: cupin domain-containing protein [Candidatus Limnocylindria bacterium]|jgi:mannose-6-phosphate isomerase-like protein (cupin superfamily)|nr:cupin domain-containing protein [Candidatus Limnocylindria bacterium]